MREFFGHSESGIFKLKELCQNPETIFAFDYDGTLAAITDTPSQAFMSPLTFSLLEKLHWQNTQNSQSQIVIISGRQAQDLRHFIPWPEICLIGNHGSEGLVELSSESDHQIYLSLCSSWHHSLKEIFSQLPLPLPRIGTHIRTWIEDKDLSLSLHYRVPDQGSEILLLQIFRQAISQLSPRPRLIMGKNVINLVPWNSPTKGQVLQKLLDRQNPLWQRALFIGDDETDEDVFNLQDPRLLTIRVGWKEKSLAQYYLNSQHDIDQVLKTILHFNHTHHSS